jgi:hypothetical protein
MTKVILNNFSGGVAEDNHEARTNTLAMSRNIDIKSFKNKIVPYPQTNTQTQDASATGTYSNGAVVTTLSNGIQRLAFLGKTSSSGPVFYGQSDTTIGGTVLGYTNGNTATTGYSVARGTLVSYKYKLICMGYGVTDAKMYSYDGVTTTFATVGTISDFPTNISTPNIPKPFRHPADDILYCGVGRTMGVNNNGSFTTWANIPTDMWITSLCEYGSYLAIACSPRNPGGRSRVYLWDRDTSKTTFAEIIDWGEGELKVLENIDGVLVGISMTNYAFAIKSQMKLSVYQGGVSATPVKTLTATDFELLPGITYSNNLYLDKAKKGNELYFYATFQLPSGYVNSQLWVAGKNRDGEWYLNPDRYINNTNLITAFNGFDFIGDYVWVGFNSGSFSRTYIGGASSAVYPDSEIKTLVNPKMPIEDRKKKKRLESVYISTIGGGEFTISYSVDGGDFVQLFTGDIRANTTKEINNESTGTPFKPGREFQFKVVIESQAYGDGVPDISEIGYKYLTTESFMK